MEAVLREGGRRIRKEKKLRQELRSPLDEVKWMDLATGIEYGGMSTGSSKDFGGHSLSARKYK
jgi:hypothetical protein